MHQWGAREESMDRFVARSASWLAIVLMAACAGPRRGDGDDDGDEPSAEACANGYDDDEDLLVDCFDPDCADLAMCAPREVCDNDADDDRDGALDCSDPDCSWREECGDLHETRCDDGRDDDGDGLVDCDEPECAAAAACRAERPANVDCDAVCAHQAECGIDMGPSCAEDCRCSVDTVLNPDFATDYYGCMQSSSCGELQDPNACLSDTGDLRPTPQAQTVIASCTQRDDCQGFPCDFLAMLSDELLADIDQCFRGSDCITCIDVSQQCL